jgi:glycosyltransferase involved in cell wall biosynthesis
MIKVVYVVPSLDNVGPTNQLYYLLYAVDKELFDVQIVTLFNKSKDVQYKKFSALNIPIQQMNLHNIFVFLAGIRQLRKYIKGITPDIIHSHLFRADLISALFLYKYKQVATVRGEVISGSHYVDELGIFRGYVYKRLHTIALKKIQNIVSISYAVFDDLKDKGILSLLIKNSIYIQEDNKANNSNTYDLRQKLAISTHQKVFIYAGSIIERKRVDIILKAFAILNDRHAVLLILGSGILFDTFKEKYKPYSNILFLGFHANVLDYIRISDFFISASKTEGMPNAVLEATSLGKLCILSDIKPHKEILPKRNSDKFLFSLGNVQELASKMQMALLLTDKQYNELSNELSQNTHNDFNSIVMSQKYQQLYKDIYNAS